MSREELRIQLHYSVAIRDRSFSSNRGCLGEQSQFVGRGPQDVDPIELALLDQRSLTLAWRLKVFSVHCGICEN